MRSVGYVWFCIPQEYRNWSLDRHPLIKQSLRDDVSPAFQLRRYAWSANLPLSILTDFQEFALYDCRVVPNKADKSSTARTLYLSYIDYDDRWDDVASLFSREAVLDGALEKYAETLKTQKGVATVDAAFLKEIESWRELLARNIAVWNPQLSQRELNFAVQMTIDRIIFLRICEDRGIEPYGRLLALQNGGETYPRLCDLFRQADDRYNSGLFHFHPEKDRPELPDDLTMSLYIDEEPLKKIIKSLYYPDSPYEFSVLPVEILGQVYEQFLGKVIYLTSERKAVVEDKPEVRKAGGVYYTPVYIVEYIVKNTIGKLLEGRTPKQAVKIKILDPACGSGSFLIGAYQYLLDWHRNQYVTGGTEKHRKELYQGLGGEWRLTTAERKRILVNNIFGVDIDPQAVEVTKLSLLLKVLEGESEQTLATQLRLIQERALPDLSNNIKCGNSLIGPDFYDQQQISLINEEDIYRLNVFDWESEYESIMASGGFDTVIGNPPYGIVFDAAVKPYLENQYPTFGRNNDTYVAFSQKAVQLLKPDGMFGFIIPNTFLVGPYFDDFKQYVLSGADVLRIVDFGINQVFPKPNVFTALLFLRKRAQEEPGVTSTASFVRVSDLSSFPRLANEQSIDGSALESLRWLPGSDFVGRLMNIRPQLIEMAWVKDVGLNYWTKGRGKTRGGSIADRVLYSGEQQDPGDIPYLKGRDVERYTVGFSNHWLRSDYQRRLDPEVDTFRFSPEFLEREKIVYRQTADRIIAAIDTNKMLTDKTLHTIVLKDEWQGKVDLCYLLGLLNSRLMTYLYRDLAQEEGRTFAQVKTFRIKQLPILLNVGSDPNSEAHNHALVELVEQMMSLHKQLDEAKTAFEKTTLQRRMDAADRQINRLVYELYGLTDEEIKIVEESY